MPGLIDAHVHVYAATADLGALEEWAPSYLTARAAGILRGMLDRGFTTVRDVAGADYGIAAAVAEGLLPGPRVIFGGKALSQTGGHGDGWYRSGQTVKFWPTYPGMPDGLVDGPEAMRRKVRELVRELAAAGVTVFLNSHLLTEVEAVCDRVAIVSQGRVVASGPLDDLAGAVADRDPGGGRPGVADHVGQGLLDDPVGRQIDAGRQRRSRSVHP